MAEHAAEQRRNWLIALGAAALLLILLALTLSFCDNSTKDGNTASAPGSTASSETLPPVNGPASSGSPGTLSPKTTATPTGNDGPGVDPAATTPLATKSPSPSKRASTKPTPAGGVDAGGGGGLSGRRVSLLVAGVFLMLAALVTARFAVGRPARG
ncbi:hypothetical protein [Actinoplanes sp. NPDC020271]|uniref:hypothetical protein n=1 Tax=Actinoplanes sp. NPDC020271 TaxID=3363896 RepID=UPI0037ABC8D7